MSEIERLEQRCDQLRADLRRTEKELADARVLAAPFKVGDVVFDSVREEEVLIREIEPQSWGCWYRVSGKKKNGEWSGATRRLSRDPDPAREHTGDAG